MTRPNLIANFFKEEVNTFEEDTFFKDFAGEADWEKQVNTAEDVVKETPEPLKEKDIIKGVSLGVMFGELASQGVKFLIGALLTAIPTIALFVVLVIFKLLGA